MCARRCPALQIDTALARVGASRFGELPVRSLSAGQRRRVALAALTLFGAQLWVLDEPSTNLDAAGQDLVCQLIAEHLRGGGAVVAAVHHALHLGEGQLVRHELGGDRMRTSWPAATALVVKRDLVLAFRRFRPDGCNRWRSSWS